MSIIRRKRINSDLKVGGCLAAGLLPDLKLHTVYDIDSARLYQRGIRGIIFDIDNTLENHRTATPGKQTAALLRRLQDEGFALCLISNGKKTRVEKFAARLGLPAIGRAGKPLLKNFRAALRIMGTNKASTAIVGDQIFTDIWGGNRAGILTILVDPIEQYENKLFYIKRYFEQFITKRIKE